MKKLICLFGIMWASLATAQVGPSVTYEKFMQEAPPLKQVGVIKLDAGLRTQRWSIGCECLEIGRAHV